MEQEERKEFLGRSLKKPITSLKGGKRSSGGEAEVGRFESQ